MKKQIQIKRTIVCFFILSSIGFLTNCERENALINNSNIDYEQIGIEHNRGLDYIFEALKKEDFGNASELRNFDNIFELSKQATLDFSRESIITKDVDFDELSSILQRFNLTKFKSAGTNELTSEIASQIELTSLQISFFNELDEIISNLEIGLQPTIGKILNLERDIIDKCNSDETKILLSATAIARYSLEYWTNNYEKWLNELSSNKVLGMYTSKDDDWEWFWDTLEDMGKSDLVGGAIGAGVGALAGGIGAAPGAVAGACYASAGRGIVSLLDHWGVW
ncbi:MAG: hypothetical protein U9N72_02225 [Bacteroidota bacterium]|nr:hypothetical protein [Bacteroidota bacterium]